MKVVVILGAVAIVLALRLVVRRRRQGRVRNAGARFAPSSDIGLVAAREVRERLRGRVFRIGTLLILAVVAAAIIIPSLKSGRPPPQRVGVVGDLNVPLRTAVKSAASGVDATTKFVREPDRTAADGALRAGQIDLAIVDSRALIVDKAFSSTDNSTTAQFVQAVSQKIGAAEAVEAAHLTPAQVASLAKRRALPVQSLQRGATQGKVNPTALIGVILIFLMLTQYNTWILIGVMEEKSSRVIEVLLAAVRPLRLLTGKVAGIGIVAFGQATLIVVFALVVAKVVGSDLLHGTAPLVLASVLIWLVLGYAFYCWVYAAAGSMAERQDQVQSLAIPLSLPIVFGYIMALTTASSGHASGFFTVLAYLPPTAPFAMPVLVGFGTVPWWGFLVSVVISLVCTFGVARLAANIYRRAILQTGGRVKVREVLKGSAA